MTRYVVALAALAMTGCPSTTPTDPTMTDPGPACPDNPIISKVTFPAPSATDVFFRLPQLEIALTDPDESASIAVLDPAGNSIPGTTTVDDDTVFFDFDEGTELLPLTEYTVVLTRDCGELRYTWSTSSAGQALETDVVGKVYDLNISGARWSEPAELGPALALLTTDYEILVSPTEVSTEVSFRGALGNGGDEQDLCAETFPLDGAEFDDPSFELMADQLPFEVNGFAVDIDDLFLSGTFMPDGSALAGLVLKGTIDTRPLVPAIQGEGDDAFCIYAALFNAQCEECANGDGPYCLSLTIEDIEAPEIPDATLVEWTRDDFGPECTITQ